MPSEHLAGRLLVATPVIGDPNCHRSVVFLLDHSESGALGVVINRPTDVDLDESLPGWDALAAAPGVVFVGGPVEQAGAIGLGRLAPGTSWEGLEDDDDGPWSPVLTALDSVGPLATVDLTRDPLDLEGIDTLRVFVGYAGWGPGQLEGELGQDAWVVAEARPADLWSADPEGLWGRVLRRQGGTIAWLSLHPLDPSGN
jgi:putative transcriptional regulator